MMSIWLVIMDSLSYLSRSQRGCSLGPLLPKSRPCRQGYAFDRWHCIQCSLSHLDDASRNSLAEQDQRIPQLKDNTPQSSLIFALNCSPSSSRLAFTVIEMSNKWLAISITRRPSCKQTHKITLVCMQ